MYKKLLFPLVLLILLSACSDLKKIAELPERLKENSGIAVSRNGLWIHNDSGDKALIYRLGLDGRLIDSVFIGNAQNIDWEDLAQDQQGNIYIGDFGNNRNQRKDLCIYKIPNPLPYLGDTINAEIIRFSYPNQIDFPPKPEAADFDMEAFVCWGDSLYLFSKNRSRPYSSWVKRYRLPTQAGDYVAELLDSFHINRHHFLFSITGAALSPDNKTLVLLSMPLLHVFRDFEEADFFNAKEYYTIKLPFTQKEAVDFLDKKQVLLSDEQSPLGKARLYRLLLNIPRKKRLQE